MRLAIRISSILLRIWSRRIRNSWISSGTSLRGLVLLVLPVFSWRLVLFRACESFDVFPPRCILSKVHEDAGGFWPGILTRHVIDFLYDFDWHRLNGSDASVFIDDAELSFRTSHAVGYTLGHWKSDWYISLLPRRHPSLLISIFMNMSILINVPQKCLRIALELCFICSRVHKNCFFGQLRSWMLKNCFVS